MSKVSDRAFAIMQDVFQRFTVCPDVNLARKVADQCGDWFVVNEDHFDAIGIERQRALQAEKELKRDRAELAAAKARADNSDAELKAIRAQVERDSTFIEVLKRDVKDARNVAASPTHQRDRLQSELNAAKRRIEELKTDVAVASVNASQALRERDEARGYSNIATIADLHAQLKDSRNAVASASQQRNTAQMDLRAARDTIAALRDQIARMTPKPLGALLYDKQPGDTRISDLNVAQSPPRDYNTQPGDTRLTWKSDPLEKRVTTLVGTCERLDRRIDDLVLKLDRNMVDVSKSTGSLTNEVGRIAASASLAHSHIKDLHRKGDESAKRLLDLEVHAVEVDQVLAAFGDRATKQTDSILLLDKKTRAINVRLQGMRHDLTRLRKIVLTAIGLEKFGG